MLKLNYQHHCLFFIGILLILGNIIIYDLIEYGKGKGRRMGVEFESMSLCMPK